MGALHLFFLPHSCPVTRNVRPKYPLPNAFPNTEDEMYKEKAMKLEEEVRSMINKVDTELLNILEMIDDIQRLALGHRFKSDIKNKLEKVFLLEGSDFKIIGKSLHATALIFRLLRQHGYEVSQDIFEGFLDDQGNFLAYLHKDIKGMLSLYEASHLGYEGEEILDKAMKQTSMYLKNHLGNLDSITAERVSHALDVPLHHKMIMLEARWYIESYSKREDANPILLELSKLDFNMVQSVLQRDLHDLSRWDVSAVRNLPDYMKLCFLALYNTVNEMAYDHLKEQGEDALPYLTKAWADLCKSFLQEAKWSYNKITPSFDEYLENAWRSVSGTVILSHAYFLLGDSISEQALDYLVNYDELVRCPSVIFRLWNDLGTSSAELARGETANSISCFMHETGVSEAEAREHLHKLIQKAWKNMNKCQIDNETPFPRRFVRTATNLARIAHCTYQHGDGHGAPDSRSKNRVSSLIIEPISLI
ncbi:unnamed protein product [Dovyalis caffra]|uniref:(+)-delta-cadinene synthase n=1 Tax=Dovyalis caffra TaxID=77055 RepID=A0AAV1SNW0_9ROSI|nr:unnamed protein product [Dovyalis caffra]